MSATPGHDNTPTRFWGIWPSFRVTAETNSTVKLKPKYSPESLLDGFSSFIYDAAPLRMIVPSKYILRL